MALQVWCPLLGNNNQQGLSNVTLTTPGSTMSVSTSGKLGKTYDNSSLKAGGFRTSDVVDLGSAQSMFCWFRFTSLTADSSLGCGLLSQHRYNKNTGLGLNVKYVSSTTGYITVSTGTGSSRTYNTYCGSTLLQENTWYHAGFTYDGNNVLKLYINGVCDGTHSIGKMSTPADYVMLYCWSLSGSSGGTVHGNYILNGAMNDARFYDHCLSQEEISEIAKGLVINYPLSLPQTNLLKNSNFLQGTGGLAGYTANYATLTKQTDCMKVVSSASNGGFYTNNFDAITTGDMTTFSAYVKADASMTIYIGTDGGGTSNCQSYTIGTTWKQISISKEKTTNNANLRIYGNGTFYAKLLKYELGTRITPWIPNSADTAYSSLGLSDFLEYDVSGNNYHGTKIGSPTYSSDTPRYSTSTSFNGVDDCIQVPLNTFFPNAGSFTINLWFKKSELGSKGYETVFGGISGFEMDTRNNTSTTLSYYVTGNSRGLTVQSPLNFDTWYMLTMVCDGTNELYYLNGEYKKQIEKKGMPTGNYFIGAWKDVVSQNYKGLISDFRVYATALTSTQIAELYNTTTFISNN